MGKLLIGQRQDRVGGDAATFVGELGQPLHRTGIFVLCGFVQPLYRVRVALFDAVAGTGGKLRIPMVRRQEIARNTALSRRSNCPYQFCAICQRVGYEVGGKGHFARTRPCVLGLRCDLSDEI
jgi:hypothetical protein